MNKSEYFAYNKELPWYMREIELLYRKRNNSMWVLLRDMSSIYNYSMLEWIYSYFVKPVYLKEFYNDLLGKKILKEKVQFVFEISTLILRLSKKTSNWNLQEQSINKKELKVKEIALENLWKKEQKRSCWFSEPVRRP